MGIASSEIIEHSSDGTRRTVVFRHVLTDGSVLGLFVERRHPDEDLAAWLESNATLLANTLAAAELSANVGEGL